MKLRITVHGVAYEVDVEVLDAGEGFPTAAPVRPRSKQPAPPGAPNVPLPPRSSGPAPAGNPGSVASPIAGIIVEIKCRIGDQVKEGDTVLIMEAMKMKTSIAAPSSGKVKAIPVAVGDNVRENQILVEFE